MNGGVGCWLVVLFLLEYWLVVGVICYGGRFSFLGIGLLCCW